MSLSYEKVVSLAEQVRGVSFAKSDAINSPRPGYVPVLRAGNITENGLAFDDLVFVPEEKISKRQYVRKGDVVIAASSGSIDVVGKASIATSDFEAAFGAFCKVLRPNSKVDPWYFGHFFETQQYRRHISSVASGININNLRSEDLDELKIPLPPLPEQKRIAEILDRAETLRAKRRAALAQLYTLTQSIFLDLFGEPKKEWPINTIVGIAASDNGSIRTGPFGSQLLHSEFTSEGIAVLGIDNAVANEFQWSERRFISEFKYRQLKRYTVHPGDILITIMGTCGRCAIVPDDIPIAINTKHLCCITLDRSKCLPKFLHAYFLLHPLALNYLNQTAKGAVMSGLNMGIIKEMPVSVPPLPLQHEFARRAAAVEKLKTTHRQSLAELDGLFASLQHRAFSGEL